MILFLSSCSVFYISTSKIKSTEKVKKVEFCNLSNFENKYISTKCIYSGYEEYWSASGIDSCNLDGNVNLNFNEFAYSWKRILFQSKMNKLHRNYPILEAKMNIKGYFHSDQDGYGHLGSNKSEIMIKAFKMKLKKKKKK